MPTIVEQYEARSGALFFLCDVSPPRGADRSLLAPLQYLDADAFCVAASPGGSVRAESLTVAYLIQQEFDKTAVFNLPTRDMNRLALQSHLLGAQLLGVHNVLVVRGDNLREQDKVKPVHDYRPTELVAAIGAMNRGTDFKGLRLRQPTTLCVGASVDLSRPLAAEVRLTRRKVEAGANFLMTQALYRPELAEKLLKAYANEAGGPCPVPLFYGLPIPHKDGLLLGDVPGALRKDLERGRPGLEIALELFQAFRQYGIRGFYVVPPIMRGGARDYEAAQEFFRQARR